MSKWLIFGADKTEDDTMQGFQRLNASRNREKLFKANSVIFVDDNGLTHDDINTFSAARKAGLISKEEKKPARRSLVFTPRKSRLKSAATRNP
jgi:hypothetical protein